MATAHVRTVILNTPDPEPLVAFWSGVLGVPVQATDDHARITWLRADTDGGVNLGIQQVDQPLATVTQVHLDVAVEHLDETCARSTGSGDGS